MTHGDKAKAKTGKSSQASGSKKSSSATAGKSSASRQSRGPESRQSGQAGAKISVKKSLPAPALAGKKGSASPAKETAPNGKGAKARPPVEEAGGISNPVIAAAFKRAVKKYPNAFRKLTD